MREYHSNIMRTVLTSLALAAISLLGSFSTQASATGSLDPMGIFVSPRSGMFADASMSLFFGGGGAGLAFSDLYRA